MHHRLPVPVHGKVLHARPVCPGKHVLCHSHNESLIGTEGIGPEIKTAQQVGYGVALGRWAAEASLHYQDQHIQPVVYEQAQVAQARSHHVEDGVQVRHAHDGTFSPELIAALHGHCRHVKHAIQHRVDNEVDALGKINVHEWVSDQVHGAAHYGAHAPQPLGHIHYKVSEVGQGRQEVKYSLSGLEAAQVAPLQLARLAAHERLHPAEQRHGQSHKHLAQRFHSIQYEPNVSSDGLNQKLRREFLDKPDASVPERAQVFKEPIGDLERPNEQDLEAGAQSPVVGDACLEHDVVGILEYNEQHDRKQQHSKHGQDILQDDSGSLHQNGDQGSHHVRHGRERARRDLEREYGFGFLGRQSPAREINKRETDRVDGPLEN